MSVNYKFIDEKAGLSTSGALSPSATQWVAATAYATVGVIVQNGGFSYRLTVAGTSGAAGVGPCPNLLTDNTCTWALVGAVSGLCGSDTLADPATGIIQRHELYYIALAKDMSPNDYGIGEFQYVKFTGTVVAGDLVLINRFAKTCTQSGATNGVGVGNVYGIAMGSQASGAFGWVMIRGIHDEANVSGGAVAGNVPSGSATLGQVGVAGGVANYLLPGTVSRALGVAKRGTLELEWPFCAG